MYWNTESGLIVDKIGSRNLLVADETCMNIAGDKLSKRLKDIRAETTKILFGGQSRKKKFIRISQIALKGEYDGVIAIGGGKVGDTARGVCDKTGLKLCVVPTVAASDAPTASLYAVYTNDDRLVECRFTKNPDLVLVDTEIIAQAPERFLVSGMADALATWVEVKAAAQSSKPTTAGGLPTITALAIAEKCEEIIFKFGLQAFEANRAQVATSALDAVVEANILMSGLGYESGGLSAAHAIHNALTVLRGEIEKKTHGEKVAYGTLAQLFLENRSFKEIDKFIRFYRRIGLPTTFAELGIKNISRDELKQVGTAAVIPTETIHRMPFEITEHEVIDALVAVDAYVRNEYLMR